jgi:gamma-glutamyl phosphate reductase
MEEYSRNHKRTIEEFQLVFQVNAEKFVESIAHQIKFMGVETWADPQNKQVACDQIDQLVQAINDYKEEFLSWKS